MQTLTILPPKAFLESDVRALRDHIQSFLKKRRESLVAPRTPAPPRPVTYADWSEAQRARVEFELQPDMEQKLAATHEAQFELCQIIDAMLGILASNPTEHEKRKILGFQDKKRPSIPGMADEYFHVEGNLEKRRAELARLEENLPRLQAEAARYVQIKKSLEPWPWHRINRERNDELDRQEIANGRMPHKRGGANMLSRTVTP
jgi:hypothetical protein